MSDKTKQVGDIEAAQLGVTSNHNIMENGELRFRLVASDGSSYVRTETSPSQKTPRQRWQRSHYHSNLRELYLVGKGAMVLATLSEGNLVSLRKIISGETVFTNPMQPHNVFLYSDTVIHTLKFRANSALKDERFDARDDWFASKELDKVTFCAGLNEEELEILQTGVHKYETLLR